MGNYILPGVIEPDRAVNMEWAQPHLYVRWPAAFPEHALYQNSQLTSPTGWLPVTNAAARETGLEKVTLPTTAESRFFRLQTP